MLTSGHARVAAVLILGGLSVVACGGGTSPAKSAAVATDASSPTQSRSTSSSTSASDRSSDASSDETSDDVGSGPASIIDGSYQSGAAHVEISGGQNKTADLQKVDGVTGGGSTILNFSDPGSASNVALVLSETEAETGLALTLDGLTTGGQFNEDCHLEVTHNSASEFAGKFTCTDVDGVDSSGVYDDLDITGTFSAKP